MTIPGDRNDHQDDHQRDHDLQAANELSLLPLFFEEFYPRFDRPTPPGQTELLQQAGRALYGEQYQNGLVRLRYPTPLRDSSVPSGRRNDPHVRFFLEQNPGHARGEELACLTEVAVSNLIRAGQRMLE